MSGAGEWTDALTWACGKVPTATDLVKINMTHTVTVSTGTVNAKDLNNLGRLDVKSGAFLKLNQ